MHELDLFTEALNRTDLAERVAFLDQACVGNPALRRRLDMLLAGQAESGNPLDRPPLGREESTTTASMATAEMAGQRRPEKGTQTLAHVDPNSTTDVKATVSTPPTDAPGECPPDRSDATIVHADQDATSAASEAPTPRSARVSTGEGIGTVIARRYTLVEVIGEGGMGSVYLASQTEPIKRLVALKLIKAGVDSRGVVARFDAERQALALMDHPNIARIYDGGLTPAGQPFFVMELVNGVPLTEYCDQNRMSVQARLELFVAVCQAVQHAHQKGIIHRDLKPGNVLVTEVDGRPTPKVIDFGVAKATEMKLTNMSFAELGAIVGTPAYMSPEQADPLSMDIDTRTDVYALGVMLYELLVGSPPLETKDFGRGAILEMLRIVREVDPPRPSTRLTAAEGLPNIAANRSIEPARLAKLLHGELDWVVMKALEKDRNRRYDTANGFARDIQRYLADEVVEARPPSRGYRLKKFVKRNKIQVITASLVFLSLIGGIVGSSLGMAYARRAQQAEARQRVRADDQRDKAIAAERQTGLERDKAIAAEARTRTINDYLTADLLSQAEPANNAVEDKVTLLEVVDRAAKKVGTRFADQPELEWTVRGTIARTYHGLASWEKAEAQWRASLELVRKHDPQSSAHFVALAGLSDIQVHQGRSDAEVVRMAKTAAQGLERTLGPDHTSTLGSFTILATVYQACGRLPEAIALLERTRDREIATLGPNNPTTVIMLGHLAMAYQAAGRLTEAIELFERARDALIAGPDADRPDALALFANLATAYQAVGRLPEATAMHERIRDAQIAKLGPDHTDTLATLNNLAAAYQSARRIPEAIALYDKVLKAQIASHGEDDVHALVTLGNIATAYQASGRLSEAISLLEHVRDRQIVKLGADNPLTLKTLHNLAAAYKAAGRLTEAIELYERVRDAEIAKLGPDHPDTLNTLANLGTAYQDAGRLTEAIAVYERIRAARVAKFGPDNPSTLTALTGLAALYHAAGRVPEAIALIERIRDARLAKLGPDHPDTLSTLNDLAGAYWGTKQFDKSVSLLQDLLKRQEKQLGRNHVDTQTTVGGLGTNYMESGRLDEAIPLLEEAYLSGSEFPALRVFGKHLVEAYGKAGRSAETAKLVAELLAVARKTMPPNSPQLAGVLASNSLALLQIKAYADAEPLLRECLAIREKVQPNLWSTFNTRSQLGGALLGQKRYAEAETLLRDGYEGMKQREKTIPPQGGARLPEALDRLIELATAMNKPDDMKKWHAERAKYPQVAPRTREKK
jgi:eukaryotic-like serine/threonine-protein kinase